MTFASTFSGFGGADLGAHAAGLTPSWGVEYNDDVASVARSNGLPTLTGDVLRTDFRALETPYWYQTSPPCPSFSQANTGQGETEHDIALAAATAASIEALLPPFVSLENVPLYRKGESFRLVLQGLERAGYQFVFDVLNAADYGVPQTRKRLILVASRVRRPRLPSPTHAKKPRTGGLFGFSPQPWNGWLESVADLVEGLPDTELAPWQKARLPEELRTLLVAQSGYDGEIVTRAPGEPLFVITGNGNQTAIKAVLVDSRNASSVYTFTTRLGHEPANTVPVHRRTADCPRAVLIADQHRQYARENEPAFTVRAAENGGSSPRAILTTPRTRTVQLSPRCLARFQSFPDGYALPEGAGLACLGIGNAVPPLLMQRTIEANIGGAP